MLLSMGSQGQAVVTLQQQLQKLGYPLPKFGADGKFGKETEDALEDFQKKNGLNVDGILGPLTQERIFSRLPIREQVAISQPTAPPPPPNAPKPPAPTMPIIGVVTPPPVQSSSDSGGMIKPLLLLGVVGFLSFNIFGKKGKRK